MSVGHFHIPGHATKRDYAVYVMVATHRSTGEKKLYVGKTGDNREGCNPVISRAGNHLSFNRIHSQMRNYLKPAEPSEYDFDYFYTTFGSYVAPEECRDGINVINEMERQLNRMTQEAFGEMLLNRYKGKALASDVATEERKSYLSDLVQAVKRFLETRDGTPGRTT